MVEIIGFTNMSRLPCFSNCFKNQYPLNPPPTKDYSLITRVFYPFLLNEYSFT